MSKPLVKKSSNGTLWKFIPNPFDHLSYYAYQENVDVFGNTYFRFISMMREWELSDFEAVDKK